MFTGIITNLAKITELNHQDTKYRFVMTFEDTASIALGESIAVNGVCLTVVAKSINSLAFDVSPLTLQCTNFQNVQVDDTVNVERSLQLSDRLSGHLVSGHVDSTCQIISIDHTQNCYDFNFKVIKKDLMKYIAPKGSICLDGVSLTVNKVKDNTFSVTIIPHTFNHTNFQAKKVNDLLNLEVDLIARYLENLRHYE